VLNRPAAGIRSASAGYFAASLTALKAGRFFTQQDRTPVAVISESLARQLWPNDPPASVIGRAIRQGDVIGPLIEIVGVVEDSLLFGVAPTDPLALVAVALILLCASLLACYLPARRAAGLSPADLLRN
jgi:MacB-like periplasmic core domain